MTAVTIYTSPECTACYAAKLRMRRLGIDFEEVDLAADPAALAYVRDELGHRQAPVTVHINPSGQLESWSGFRIDRISQIATAQHSPRLPSSHTPMGQAPARPRRCWPSACASSIAGDRSPRMLPDTGSSRHPPHRGLRREACNEQTRTRWR